MEWLNGSSLPHLRVQSEAVLKKGDLDGLPSHESGRAPWAKGSARNDNLVEAVEADKTVQFVDSPEKEAKMRLRLIRMKRCGAATLADARAADTTPGAVAVATHGRDVLAEIG